MGGPDDGQWPFDPNAVQSLIYDGTSPTSQIVGLMYYAMGETPPEGFAGPNDHWHRHSNVCIKFDATADRRALPGRRRRHQGAVRRRGGFFMAITGWMVHAWVVPGWESPQGVFSHENVNVRCADGTYNTTPNGMCQGT